MPALVNRKTEDSLKSAKLSAGKKICDKPSKVNKELSIPKKVPKSPLPVEGNQPK